MKKKYELQFWEQQSVWVRRTIEIETDKNPKDMSHDELVQEVETNESVEYLDSEDNWGSARTLEYDFENDFEVEEVNND